MLGVDVDFVRVNAATRIPLLAEDRIDLAIATMGHNTQRDGQARFIRPHYYRSETTVVGPRELPVASMLDLPGRTVCVTVGNGSNAELVSQGARLMLFDEAGVLPDRLKDQTCTLAAQDDSFFAKYFTDADFNARYFQKFGFAQVPWGMAVARQGSAELARALDLISQVFHRDGLFIDIGRLHSIRLGFLRQQQEVWRTPECNTDAGTANPKLRPAAAQHRAAADQLRARRDELRALGRRSAPASISPCRCSRRRRPGRCSRTASSTRWS